MLILASKSPRRKELLSFITPDFLIIPAVGEENADKALMPGEFVQELAVHKAGEVYSAHSDDIVIGADTVVWIDGKILGKPSDREDAARMLRLLSGRVHSVFTGVCIMSKNTEISFFEETKVRFFSLSDDEIEKYIETGEPFDKAGAYGIQDKGALLVEGIDGDFYNVMGLPVGRLARELRFF
ncbi:MAG: septum formation inhibitor Maf [Ruminiclostridium sp.]|nr:septum formation inhibitor Maf [Ruminiclostridium sp.]